jgi:hypothetical protein
MAKRGTAKATELDRSGFYRLINQKPRCGFEVIQQEVHSKVLLLQ